MTSTQVQSTSSKNRSKKAAPPVEPTQIEAGHYEYKGWHVKRVNNQRWDIFEDGQDPAMRAKSLKAALQIIDDGKVKAVAASVAPRRGGKGKKVPSKQDTSQKVGHKITLDMIHQIRKGFDALGGHGKVQYYKDMAAKLDLGVETVAKIARRDIYTDVAEA